MAQSQPDAAPRDPRRVIRARRVYLLNPMPIGRGHTRVQSIPEGDASKTPPVELLVTPLGWEWDGPEGPILIPAAQVLCVHLAKP